jgi:hypothetical protein
VSQLECTQNFKGDDVPEMVEWLKKFATVIITGTPYAKISRDKDGTPKAIQAVFADKIEIVAFAPKKESC